LGDLTLEQGKIPTIW